MSRFGFRWIQLAEMSCNNDDNDDDDLFCNPQFMPPRQQTLRSRPTPVTMTRPETRIWETGTVLTGWRIQTW